jgi:hypothetical protein
MWQAQSKTVVISLQHIRCLETERTCAWRPSLLQVSEQDEDASLSDEFPRRHRRKSARGAQETRQLSSSIAASPLGATFHHTSRSIDQFRYNATPGRGSDRDSICSPAAYARQMQATDEHATFNPAQAEKDWRHSGATDGAKESSTDLQCSYMQRSRASTMVDPFLDLAQQTHSAHARQAKTLEGGPQTPEHAAAASGLTEPPSTVACIELNDALQDARTPTCHAATARAWIKMNSRFVLLSRISVQSYCFTTPHCNCKVP